MAGGWPAGSGRWSGPVARANRRLRPILASFCIFPIVAAVPAEAASNNVRITNLSDIAFGAIANLSSDSVQSESLCVYANTATSGYNVRAIGSGSGGAFSLGSAAGSLPFEVEWSSSSGQSSGSQLAPNATLGGQISSASQQTCNSGPATSASLVLILRTAALSSAPAGSYNGTLTLIVGPE